MFVTDFVRLNSSTVKAVLTPFTLSSGSTFGEKRDSSYIFVLDNSGSMSGARINKCVEFIDKMLQNLGKADIIIFNSVATTTRDITTFKNNTSGGGTLFVQAFDALVALLKSKEREGGIFNVIFFTDGEDMSQSDVFGSVKKLKNDISKYSVVIHTLGVDSGSHTQLMLDISKAGSIEGTYGYIKTSNPETHEQELERLLFTVGSGTKITFRGKDYFMGKDPISVFFSDTTNEYPPATPEDVLEYEAHEIKEMVEHIDKADSKRLEEIVADLEARFRSASKLNVFERKTARSKVMSLMQICTDLRAAIEKNREMTHEQLALLSTRARDVRSKAFSRIASQALTRNADVISEEDEKIKQIYSTLTPEELGQQPSDLSCMLSCNNVADLLSSGDCLGVAFQVLAGEVCIADPTRVKFLYVSTSQFGCSEFIEACRYKARGTETSFLHPGDVVVDSSRHPVSGVLPLYLNEAHWKLARLYARRMASYLLCHDAMVGSNKITFYAYVKALEYCKQQTGDYYKKLHSLLKETLVHLYKYMKDVIPEPNEFLNDINKRTPDVVPSIPTLMCAYEELGLDYPRFYCLEENLRRKETSYTWENLCPIDESVMVKPWVFTDKKDSDDYFTHLRNTIKILDPKALPYFDKTVSSSGEAAGVKKTAPPDVQFEPVIKLPDDLPTFLKLSLS